MTSAGQILSRRGAFQACFVGAILFTSILPGQEGQGPEPEPLPVPAAVNPLAGSSGQQFNNDPSIPLPERPVETVPGVPGSWYDVATDRRRVTEVIRAQWVSLNRNGQLVGRVSVIDPITAALQPVEGLEIGLLREGETFGRTQTDRTGRFAASGLQPGVYTMVATGPRGFMAYSLSVLSFAQAQRQAALAADPIQLVQLGGVREQLEIDAAAVPPTFNSLTRIVQRYYPQIRVSQVTEQQYQVAIQQQQQAPGGPGPAAGTGLRGLNELQAGQPPARDATSIRQHDVLLNADGTMIGRLHSIDQLTGRPKQVEDVNVYVLQDDDLKAQVTVNNLGIFEVKGLQPGSYGLIAAGRSGFGAVGFRLVRAPQPGGDARIGRHRDLFQFAVQRRPVPVQLVQNPVGGANMAFPFSMSLVDDPRNIRAAFAMSAPQPVPLAAAAPANAPLMPPVAPMGGAAGGSGNNNSGFAGGGGGLLAAAAIASAIALPLALDDNGNTTELISPFSPNPPPDTTTSASPRNAEAAAAAD